MPTIAGFTTTEVEYLHSSLHLLKWMAKHDAHLAEDPVATAGRIQILDPDIVGLIPAWFTLKNRLEYLLGLAAAIEQDTIALQIVITSESTFNVPPVTAGTPIVPLNFTISSEGDYTPATPSWHGTPTVALNFAVSSEGDYTPGTVDWDGTPTVALNFAVSSEGDYTPAAPSWHGTPTVALNLAIAAESTYSTWDGTPTVPLNFAVSSAGDYSVPPSWHGTPTIAFNFATSSEDDYEPGPAPDPSHSVMSLNTDGVAGVSHGSMFVFALDSDDNLLPGVECFLFFNGDFPDASIEQSNPLITDESGGVVFFVNKDSVGTVSLTASVRVDPSTVSVVGNAPQYMDFT